MPPKESVPDVTGPPQSDATGPAVDSEDVLLLGPDTAAPTTQKDTLPPTTAPSDVSAGTVGPTINEPTITDSPQDGEASEPNGNITLPPDEKIWDGSSKSPTGLNTSVSVEEVAIDQKPETALKDGDVESGLGIGLKDILLIAGLLLVGLFMLGGIMLLCKKHQVMTMNDYTPYCVYYLRTLRFCS